MGQRVLLVLMFLCLLSGWGLAQDTGQGQGGQGGQGQGQEPSSGDRSSSQSGQPRGNRQFRRPVFLSGKVVLDDGEPPAEPTQVGLVCQGTTIQQVYTSVGGSFGFQIDFGGSGVNTQLPIDASISSATYSQLGGGMAGGSSANSGFPDTLGSMRGDSVNLSACELEAELAGFRSDKIHLGPRRALDNPDVGVIVLHRSTRAQTATISLKTLAAPKDAKKAYEKALKELGKKKVNFKKTSEELEKAVKIYPEFAAAWHLLGEVRLELQDRTPARQAFEQAMSADPEYANPYIALAMLEIDQGRWEEAAQFSGQALELDSQLVRAHYFHALANSSLGRLDVAEESVLQVQKSSTAENYPLAHYILGWIMAQKGDFILAAAEYRRFLEITPTSQTGARLEAQLASWAADGLIPTLETSEKQD